LDILSINHTRAAATESQDTDFYMLKKHGQACIFSLETVDFSGCI